MPATAVPEQIKTAGDIVVIWLDSVATVTSLNLEKSEAL